MITLPGVSHQTWHALLPHPVSLSLQFLQSSSSSDAGGTATQSRGQPAAGPQASEMSRTEEGLQPASQPSG